MSTGVNGLEVSTSERIDDGWDVWVDGGWAGIVDPHNELFRPSTVRGHDAVESLAEAARIVADAFIEKKLKDIERPSIDAAMLQAMAVGPAWIFLTKMSNRCRVVSLEPDALDILGITDRDANQHKRIGSYGVELWRCRFSRGDRWSYGTSAPMAIDRAVAIAFKLTKREAE